MAESASEGPGRLAPTQLDRLADELRADGICVLRGILDPAVIDRWASAFDAVVRERGERPGAVAARGPGRFYVTLPWCAPFSDPAVFAHPDVVGILDRILAPDYVMVQLAADTPVRGSEHQATHRDHSPLFHDDLVTPIFALAVNFPLCDVDEQNGPLEMARGTHRMARDVGLAKIASGELRLEPFPMRKGDVVIRSPLALHRGTPNRTDRPRPMVVTGWVMRWLHTPKVELAVPRQEWEALPDPIRRLLRCDVVDTLPGAPVETYVEFQY